ncbi:MAG TPA: DUF3019 domain-containing protein [Steroidobacteraceae bacterium]
MRFSMESRVSRCAAILIAAVLTGGMGESSSGIQLEIRPQVCTLAASETQCSTTVHAKWRSPREESLCLVILGRTDVKRCWEHYSEGSYSIELVFSEDLLFELKDSRLETVLASEALRIIREALRYRHRRRAPWNIFE